MMDKLAVRRHRVVAASASDGRISFPTRRFWRRRCSFV